MSSPHGGSAPGVGVKEPVSCVYGADRVNEGPDQAVPAGAPDTFSALAAHAARPARAHEADMSDLRPPEPGGGSYSGRVSPVSPELFLASAGDVPPPLTVTRILTAWTVDPWLAAIIAVIGGVYLYGVSTLTRRGDKWPIGRTVAFVGGGLGTMAVATMSSLGTYDDTLISVHMIQHMILSMVTPVLLCLGAPVTLALRTLPVLWRKR